VNANRKQYKGQIRPFMVNALTGFTTTLSNNLDVAGNWNLQDPAMRKVIERGKKDNVENHVPRRFFTGGVVEINLYFPTKISGSALGEFSVPTEPRTLFTGPFTQWAHITQKVVDMVVNWYVFSKCSNKCCACPMINVTTTKPHSVKSAIQITSSPCLDFKTRTLGLNFYEIN